MITSLSDLGWILLQTFLIFAITFFIYRKYLVSVFDPLFFFLIMQSFTMMMAFIQIEGVFYLVNYLLCTFLFTIGFISINPQVKKINDYNFSYPKNTLLFVNYFNLFAFILIILANSILISQKGLAILSNDPSVVKFSEFDEGGGFGVVRRINWGLGNLVNVSILYVYLKTKRKRNLIMLLVLFLISLSSGAKGAVLNYVALIGLLSVFERVALTDVFKNIGKIKIPILLFGFLSAIFIIMKTTGENSTLQDGLIHLGIRFLYFGDAIIYYYTPDIVAHFNHYNFIDFLSYHFNSILGIFRIVDYKKPLGNELLLYYIDNLQDTGLSIGPNTPYYIGGYIFFGYFGALVFSFCVGRLVGFIRKLLFSTNGKRISFLVVILIIYLNIGICSFPQDTQLVFAMWMDTILFGSFPLILSMMVCKYLRSINPLSLS